jgi:hypothetical protein
LLGICPHLFSGSSETSSFISSFQKVGRLSIVEASITQRFMLML